MKRKILINIGYITISALAFLGQVACTAYPTQKVDPALYAMLKTKSPNDIVIVLVWTDIAGYNATASSIKDHGYPIKDVYQSGGILKIDTDVPKSFIPALARRKEVSRIDLFHTVITTTMD